MGKALWGWAGGPTVALRLRRRLTVGGTCHLALTAKLTLPGATCPVPREGAGAMGSLQWALSWLAGGGRWARAHARHGAFPVKRLFWVVVTVFCSERERPFFVPSPAISFAERAEGVKGPKR